MSIAIKREKGEKDKGGDEDIKGSFQHLASVSEQ
jgi:hypothetical protein